MRVEKSNALYNNSRRGREGHATFRRRRGHDFLGNRSGVRRASALPRDVSGDGRLCACVRGEKGIRRTDVGCDDD